MDVIAVVDPLVSQVSARTFKQYLHGPFCSCSETSASQRFSRFLCAAIATKNIEAMRLTEPD